MGDITRVQGKLDLVEALKQYRTPLWITEMGWPTHTNPAMANDGAFVAGLIRRAARLRFPGEGV